MSIVEDILIENSVPFVGEDHYGGRAGWVHIACPPCGYENEKFHLGISLTTGAATCWKCGSHSA